jgi:protein ImuB
MRLACVFAPRLALQAVLRRTPEANGTACALLDREYGKRIKDATPDARRAGVRAGMTIAQAETVCPGVRLLTASAADIEAAEAALSDVGYAFAPRIESCGESVFFAVEDLGQLFPTEQAIVQAVQAQTARLGLGTRVAIADSKGVASIATRAREAAVVPPGSPATRAFLAPLSVRLFSDDPSLREAFDRWGIRTAGELAALPTAQVTVRLGKAGARACKLARGEDDEAFVPRFPADALEEGLDLDYGVAELEPLSFLLRGLVDRILQRLACRSLACAGLTVRLALEPRGLDVRTVPVAAPTRETSTLLDLVRLDLARRPPSAPVVGVRLLALPARVRATQLDLLRPAGPAPDRLAATVARLAALVGPENVGAPATVDTWREEAVAVVPFAVRNDAQAAASPREPTLTIRRRRPPEAIEVLMGRDEPTALRGKETTARILVAAGPYRMSGEWWDDDHGGWAREYWNVHASDGAVYRIHRDQQNGQWFLDGYFD